VEQFSAITLAEVEKISQKMYGGLSQWEWVETKAMKTRGHEN
jgi:hypothetical protein